MHFEPHHPTSLNTVILPSPASPYEVMSREHKNSNRDSAVFSVMHEMSLRGFIEV
jgi:hypothetical protein